ncbi:copper chaperone PCu(A)C [Brevibacterium album]|uniref:copper chaperone PCu(A)C n=1 Tax=Brevibacterium album TaxID=417948 RepID=UPI0003FEE374|nr:copper chaperone PCu(A)C [Brevibacterium album]
MRTRTLMTLPAVLTAASLMLAACGSGEEDGASAAEAPAADSATLTDPWAKAAEEGMTSAFGLVENTGEEEITLAAVESPVSDHVELHTTNEDGSGGMSMEEQEGGFPIAPGETLTLEPGAEHIMLMDLAEPLEHGTTTELTLVFSDDSTLEVTADVRDFAGAQENYGGMEDEDYAGHGETAGDHDSGEGDAHAEHSDE